VSEQAQLLARAQDGEEAAFAALTASLRPELELHCYRIVGSVQDAEDLVQETLLTAWREIKRFEGRSSVRTWLYRIATNRCLNALRDRGRRPAETRAPPEPVPPPPKPTRMSQPRVSRALSRCAARGSGGPSAAARCTIRVEGGDRARVHDRAAPGATPTASCARAPGRAWLPRSGGRRDARTHRGVSQPFPAARAARG